jgi:ATP-binding cassette subfamily B (MDR/TAP) protein 6
LFSGRVVNAFLPLTLGALFTTFDTPGVVPFSAFGASPWPYLITYVLLYFLASSGGLAAIRDALWIPLMQYGNCSMLMLSFNLVLALSLSWHTKHKTGELIGFTVIPVDTRFAPVVFCLKLRWALWLES